MKRIMFMVLLSLSGGVFANSSCDKPRDNFDDVYCLNKVYQEADKELNEQYKKLQSQLDGSGKTALKAGQLMWIENRNKNCSRHETDGFFINLSCATNTTVERLQFIQDRSRECSSSGCQNSKL